LAQRRAATEGRWVIGARAPLGALIAATPSRLGRPTVTEVGPGLASRRWPLQTRSDQGSDQVMAVAKHCRISIIISLKAATPMATTGAAASQDRAFQG